MPLCQNSPGNIFCSPGRICFLDHHPAFAGFLIRSSFNGKEYLLIFWLPLLADGWPFPSEIIGTWDLQGERESSRGMQLMHTLRCVFFFLLYNEIVAKKHDWTSLSGLPYFPPSFIKGCWCYIYLPFSQHVKSLVPHTCCVTAPLLHPHSLPGKQVSLIVVLKPIPWYCIKEGVYGWNFIKIPYPKSWVLPHLCFSSCKQPVADKASKELRECFELVQSLLRNKWLKTYAPKSSSFVEKQNSACHFVL